MHEEWKELSDNKKQEYKERAKEQKENWKKEKEEICNQHIIEMQNELNWKNN